MNARRRAEPGLTPMTRAAPFAVAPTVPHGVAVAVGVPGVAVEVLAVAVAVGVPCVEVAVAVAGVPVAVGLQGVKVAVGVPAAGPGVAPASEQSSSSSTPMMSPWAS